MSSGFSQVLSQSEETFAREQTGRSQGGPGPQPQAPVYGGSYDAAPTPASYAKNPEYHHPFYNRDALLKGEHCSTRGQTVRIRGSPIEFAANPDAATELIFSKRSVQYRRFGSARGSERFGDVKRGLILFAFLQQVSNSFPYAIVIKSNVLPGNSYSKDQRGIYIVAGNHTHTFDTPFQIHGPSEHLNTTTAVDFGHYEPGDFDRTVSRSLTNPNLWTVTTDSPAVGILQKNQQRLGYDLVKFANVRDGQITGFDVPADYIAMARECFNNKIVPNRPTVNMLEANISIERLGADWLDPINFVYHDATSKGADGGIFSMYGEVVVTAIIMHRLVIPVPSALGQPSA